MTQVSIVSGGTQTTAVLGVFSQPLTVKVTDDAGVALVGATVTFTAPDSGASGSFTGSGHTASAGTDSSGVAVSPTFTANDQPGTYQVLVTAVPADAPAPVATDKILGTHYFVPYPLSFRGTAGGSIAGDTGFYYDSGYLDPNGEGGIHRAYGGKLRDRPPTADVLSGTPSTFDGYLHDQQVEVARIKAAGFNATFIDLLAFDNFGSREWQLTRAHLDAAHTVDAAFRVIPMPDCTGGLGVSCNAGQLAAAIADLASRPACYRFTNGRVLVAPFTPETRTVAFWNDVASQCAAKGVQVSWLWCVQNYNAQAATFAGIANTWGLTAWGDNSPPGAIGTRFRGSDAHSKGVKWVQTLRIQDQRPPYGIFDEPVGSQLLREFWLSARQCGAEGVQAITWNDFSEATQFAPSKYNGNPSSWGEINKFYMDWFTSGSAPTPAKDFVAVIHRKQHTSVAPSFPETLRMSLRGGSAAVTNIVEVMTWLTAPAQVTATVGGVAQAAYTAPAGEYVRTFPVSTSTQGAPSASVSRSGTQTVSVTSRNSITTTPVVEDFTYYATHARQA